MKNFLVIPILAALIFSGCSKESTVVGPPQQNQVKNEWIKLNNSSSLSVENTYTASKTIDGSKGGTISLSKAFNNNGNWAIVTASLTIPKNAFSGSKLISYTVDTDCAGIVFSPAGLNFKKNLSLDLVFTGVDISAYDPKTLGFCYLDDNGYVVPSRWVYANANIAQGLLVVTGAQITHFSRYGWGTIDGPIPDPIVTN
jgi:hypothetical protein